MTTMTGFPFTNRRQFLNTAFVGCALAGAGANIFALSDSTSIPADSNSSEGDEKLEGKAILDGLPITASRYDGTVAVWFSSHYQVDQRDWLNIKEFGNRYHPLAGYYKSDDPTILKKQLHWMRRAGIDAIVYDVFSTGAWSLTDLPKDKALALLLKELSAAEGDGRHFKLIIWLEKYWSMPTPEEFAYAFDYIKEHLAHEDFYFRYEGKPLVVPYLNGVLGDLDDTFEKYRGEFAIRYIRPGESDFWSYIEHFPQQIRKGWMCASPGMDAYLENAHVSRHMKKETSPTLETIRANAERIPRLNGATFVQQLQRAKQNNPTIIFISGWNDWQYGCQIEPAVEYGCLYLDIAAKTLGRWTETKTFRDE
jgi:hypothetical protein